jgi:hypothetical protein
MLKGFGRLSQSSRQIKENEIEIRLTKEFSLVYHRFLEKDLSSYFTHHDEVSDETNWYYC